MSTVRKIKVHTLYRVTQDGETTESRENDYEQDVKNCDICGADASLRSPCSKCRQDLCSKHQLDLCGHLSRYGVEADSSSDSRILSGVYCKKCLIELIQGM